MRGIGVLRIAMIAAAAAAMFCGCIQRKPDDDGGTKAPGSTRSSSSSRGSNKSKIVFKYDPRAPKELLKIQKGAGEGEQVAVYVGDTRVGTLSFGTVVQKIGEEKGWYKIRYCNNDAEFFGYIRYSEAIPTDRPRQTSVIMVGEDARPKILSMQEADDELASILKVPYELKVLEGEEDDKPRKFFSSGKNTDGYDDILTLEDYKNDPQAHVYARKMYQDLSELFKKSPPKYQEVLNLYGEALTAFTKKDVRMFKHRAESAKQKRDYIMGAY